MTLLSGIVIGLLYALVPGGTIVMGLRLSTDGGFRRHAAYTYGVLLVDVCYGLLAVMIADEAAGAYRRAAASWKPLLPMLQYLLVVLLVAYGVLLVVRNATRTADPSTTPAATAGARPFLIGVGLKAATIASPSFIGGLALLTAGAGSLGLAAWDAADRVLFALGYGLGNFLYLQTCMRLAARMVAGAERRTLVLWRRGMGAAFILLGVVLLFQILSASPRGGGTHLPAYRLARAVPTESRSTSPRGDAPRSHSCSVRARADTLR